VTNYLCYKTNATLTASTDVRENRYFRAVFDPVSSLWPFNTTGDFLLIPPGEDCDLDGRDLSNKIVMLKNFTCQDNYSRITKIEELNALVRRLFYGKII